MAIGNLTLDNFLPSERDFIIIVLKLCTCRINHFNDLLPNMFKDFEILVYAAEQMQLDVIVQTAWLFSLYAISTCHGGFVCLVFAYHDLYINKILLVKDCFL